MVESNDEVYYDPRMIKYSTDQLAVLNEYRVEASYLLWNNLEIGSCNCSRHVARLLLEAHDGVYWVDYIWMIWDDERLFDFFEMMINDED